MSACIKAVAIGASAGALEALTAILPALPANYSRAVLVVVHLPAGRESILVELLRDKCELRVREAEDKEPIEPSTIYFAPPDYHLLIESDKRLSLSSEELVNYSRPSIDVLFESAAEAFGPDLIGVVLTGANHDGADGLRAIQAGGGIALVQRPDLAYSPQMPQAALDACPTARALSLSELAKYLSEAALS